MEFSRRNLLSAGLATGALATGAFVAHAAGSTLGASNSSVQNLGTEQNPLKIGYVPIVDAAPLLIAHERGDFKAQGIYTAAPVLFRSWSSLVEAFIARRVDIIHLLMPMSLYLRYQLRVDAKVLGWNHTNGSALTLDPSLESVEQLAGRTLAVPSWFSIHNIIVQQRLRAANLRPVIRALPDASRSEVGLIVMSPADMIPALAAQTIAGFAVADPFNAAAHLRSTGRIEQYLGDMWRDHACCATVVHGDIARSGTLAEDIAAAIVSASAFTRSEREASAKILSDSYLPQDARSIAYALAEHEAGSAGELCTHSDWRGNRLDFAPFPYESYTRELVQQFSRTLVDAPTGFLSSLHAESVHSDLVHDAPVRTALSAYGLQAFNMSGFERNEEVSFG